MYNKAWQEMQSQNQVLVAPRKTRLVYGIGDGWPVCSLRLRDVGIFGYEGGTSITAHQPTRLPAHLGTYMYLGILS
jgi:hypothetical protein